MLAKRRRRRRRRAVLAAVLLCAVLAGAGAAFYFFYVPAADRSGASAQMPQGVVRGLAVRTGPSGDVLNTAVTSDELVRQAQSLAAEARARGMNALFLSVTDGGALLYRDRYLPLFATLAPDGRGSAQTDGLAALCAAASEQGLAVCAALDRAQLDAGGDKLAASLSRMFRRYPLAAVYVRESGDGAAFDRYIPVRGSALELDGAAAGAWADPSALFLRTVQDRETGRAFSGAVFDRQTAAAAGDTLGLMLSAMDGGTPPALLDYTPRETLSVTYPADSAVIGTASCFVMGTSNPAQELLLDGAPVQRPGESGAFGVLVSVAEGENTFTFTQGDQSVALRVTRPVSAAPAPSAGGTAEPRPHDATVKVEPGTAVQTAGWLTSLLYDPSSDGNISETVRGGAVAAVKSCVETVRGGKSTWAYQLASGDFVLAYNTKALEGDAPRTLFTGATASASGRDEVLAFEGSGTPLAYTNAVDNTLVLHFYGADAAQGFAVQGSNLVKSVSAQPLPDGAGTEIVLTFDAPLWGHSVEYENGATRLLLKKAPSRGQDPAKPLAGTTVLLDPGHGASDTGAMGTGGSDAPTEKDVNLAVSLAARYRLEQLGAKVEMIRSDDSFLSLEERNRKIIALRPDFFIAVHHNSVQLTVDANASAGTECYYFYNAGKALAAALSQNISAAASRPNRGAQWGYYYVTRSTLCPAVLLEAGFMVNPAEYESVTSDGTLWATGDAIARSVLACLPS